MITLNHIEIYKSYSGDGDGFVRFTTARQKAIMDYKHWALVESLIQDIRLVKNGLASEIYMKTVNERLQENCDNEETIRELKKIA
ncbi:hypothetical protein [Pinibacter aurantiacus]|uniref:Uncharacterized protein n=1 Tax=Pinibacter aurantiacus TaxID=2851599 RepID=A0A9E2W745_9BACT|nr:hypothetical protein [Pinibacter aurantiacus]MBV4360603.1 hypothetical protein [Pinibacter aurantiacus]